MNAFNLTMGMTLTGTKFLTGQSLELINKLVEDSKVIPGLSQKLESVLLEVTSDGKFSILESNYPVFREILETMNYFPELFPQKQIQFPVPNQVAATPTITIPATTTNQAATATGVNFNFKVSTPPESPGPVEQPSIIKPAIKRV